MDNNSSLKNPATAKASIICMIVTISLFILGIVLSTIGVTSGKPVMTGSGGFLIIFSIATSLGGIITGIIACCSSKEYKKTLSIVGLSINGGLLFLVVMLLVVGASIR